MADTRAKLRCRGCQLFFPAPILKCARCGWQYCSPKCQKDDWPKHKAGCKKLHESRAAHGAILAKMGQSLYDPDVSKSGHGPVWDQVVALWGPWSEIISNSIVQLYKEYMQLSTPAGRERAKTQTLYIQVTPCLKPASYRDTFKITGCDIDRTSDPYVSALLADHVKNPSGKDGSNVLGSVMFELELGAILPEFKGESDTQKMTNQFVFSAADAADTPLVPNIIAWLNFRSYCEETWGAYD